MPLVMIFTLMALEQAQNNSCDPPYFRPPALIFPRLSSLFCGVG